MIDVSYRIMFPYQYSPHCDGYNGKPTSPDIIYLCAHLKYDEEIYVVGAFSFAEMIDDFMAAITDGNNPDKISGANEIVVANTFGDMLTQQANRLYQATGTKQFDRIRTICEDGERSGADRLDEIYQIVKEESNA